MYRFHIILLTINIVNLTNNICIIFYNYPENHGNYLLYRFKRNLIPSLRSLSFLLDGIHLPDQRSFFIPRGAIVPEKVIGNAIRSGKPYGFALLIFTRLCPVKAKFMERQGYVARLYLVLQIT